MAQTSSLLPGTRASKCITCCSNAARALAALLLKLDAEDAAELVHVPFAEELAGEHAKKLMRSLLSPSLRHQV